VPTYQYACTNAESKHEFELVQSFTDAPVSECPECGAAVRKVYGSIGVVFKGSGFYRTDSRSNSGSSEGSSEKSSEKSSSEKSPSEKSSKPKESAATPAPAAAVSSSTSSGSASKAAG
jgi:putative FmdB family regulatory protein